MRAVVLGGARAVANAAWMRNGAVAVTQTELWRFRPEEPEAIRVTELAHPIGEYQVMGTLPAASLVAVGLEDGRVDVFRDGKRVRTLPAAAAGAKSFPVLDLRFSQDGKTLATTRTSTSWMEQTVFHDVETGDARGTIAGGNVVFDESGTYVAGRGGVYAVADGREIARFREGFFVLQANGKMADMNAASGREVMAGDYVARGFYKGSAFYAAEKDVHVIDPASGRVSKIAASCAPSTKVGSEPDAVRGRVIGLCSDGVLITDLARGATTRIKIPISKSGRLSPPDVELSPRGTAFVVEGLDFPAAFIDPDASSARDASPEERWAYHASSPRERCVRQSGARTAIRCDAPALRDDGAFRLRVDWGMSVTRPSTDKVVIDWGMSPYAERTAPFSNARFKATQDARVAFASHRGEIEVRYAKDRSLRYRFGPPVAGADAAEPFPATPACGKGTQYIHEANDTFAVYTGYADRNQTACHCSASGCVRREQSFLESLLAASDEPAFLTTHTNSTHTETVVRLHRRGKPSLQTKLPGGCIYGAFGPKGRAFVLCEADQRKTVYELSQNDLSIVAQRTPPAIGRNAVLQRLGDDLLAIYHERAGQVGAVLPMDWIGSGTTREKSMLYAWPTFGIRETGDGKVEIAGDEAAASETLRCYDGASLRPFAACRDATLVRR